MAATRALPTHVRSLAAAAAAAPPPNVRRVANGDRVSLMFEIFDATTGEKIIDSGNQAADVVVGRGYAIPGIERALVGMAVGDHRTETMKPDQSFGVSDPRRIVTCVRPPNMNVEVGSGVVLNDTGEWARVVAVTDQQITVDLNHPLAGRTVTVNLSLLSISDEPPPKPNEITLRTLVPGDGKTFPRSGDKVHVHYTGTLALDGKEFDSSRAPGKKPFAFVLGAGLVIQGWEEGIARLSLGERAVIHVPSVLAYGAKGAGRGVIPPHADLKCVFFSRTYSRRAH